ncbi:hypothetical protein [Streptosporangium sp. NBC_01469]|uniref:hypothetical protein n=1 Tax=Streptosporangium sp. NBC_01469 TaxID=2903898 RepID=UPI002E293981|nr:hypothetical protein [Streptosporangium sp. NBC_01469]
MSPLERLTMNLTQRGAEALAKGAELTGDTKTDTVNRALQVYAYLEQLRTEGGTILIRRPGQDELEVINFL